MSALVDAPVLASIDLDKGRAELRPLSYRDAAEIWRGVMAGQWMLVDYVDVDGRRTLLLRRAASKQRDKSRLTRLELQAARLAALGHSNKLVGYARGVGASTAATHLAKAMRKLHVRSRNELQRLLGPWL